MLPTAFCLNVHMTILFKCTYDYHLDVRDENCADKVALLERHLKREPFFMGDLNGFPC